jgi:hypothetical protein
LCKRKRHLGHWAGRTALHMMQITIFGLAVNDASAFGDAASFVDDDSKSTFETPKCFLDSKVLFCWV